MEPELPCDHSTGSFLDEPSATPSPDSQPLRTLTDRGKGHLGAGPQWGLCAGPGEQRGCWDTNSGGSQGRSGLLTHPGGMGVTDTPPLPSLTGSSTFPSLGPAPLPGGCPPWTAGMLLAAALLAKGA